MKIEFFSVLATKRRWSIFILKYNSEKLMLEKEESGNKIGVIESPHEKIKDKIESVGLLLHHCDILIEILT